MFVRDKQLQELLVIIFIRADNYSVVKEILIHTFAVYKTEENVSNSYSGAISRKLLIKS